MDLFRLTALERRLGNILGRRVDLLPEPVEKPRPQPISIGTAGAPSSSYVLHRLAALDWRKVPRNRARQCFGKESEGRRCNANEPKGPQMNADASLLNPLSKRVIGCALTVSNALGSGFLERVYENALAHEPQKAALAVEQQRGITVTYDGITVGEYFVDLLVENAVLVELKTVRALEDAHRAQCLNYLRATGRHLCPLMNFGAPRLEVRRIVLNL
jgi:GxxExxY protein